MSQWKNPSRTEVYYDRYTGKHIHPGQVINTEPHPDIVRKMIKIEDGPQPVVPPPTGPVEVASQLQPEDVDTTDASEENGKRSRRRK